jgi:hypothetical protein
MDKGMNTGMNRGMNRGLTIDAAIAVRLVLACMLYSGLAMAEVYKVVDAEGNITYTDQAPADGSAPMVLPELSVIESDYEEKAADAEAGTAAADATAPAELTPRQLRKMYKDFRITAPRQEETFWGTANTVVVSWGTSAALQPGMKVRLVVDGAEQAGKEDGMLALTLDRGEHTVSADLMDARGRKIVSTETVTFFIKQQTVDANAPTPTPKPKPRNGS